ncbi:Gfo/Idh/MocA family oxidoreductase [Streptomyces sp. SID3343]|uniref:Gfo/Idh/MocA family protein n=1 Tax=Streptomyces sp. SID3343 TaxID=2690260 RepID=UPI0013695A35|nr:Gfo/Idh/MocA family oxidoreductase [Streptomyces sp. SID3343]MYV98509.1 Gfo/Idh/MocA family oxidoreductase [Streptomyces sp. SID3343]
MNGTHPATLGIGIIGSGFIAHFHVRSWQAIRGSDIVATQSRSLDRARELASYAEDLRVGTDVTAYDDIAALVRDERVDAVWVLTPNHTRVDVVKAICDELLAGRATLRGIAVEKPLGRNIAEARQVAEMVHATGTAHAYLENQVYAPRLTRTRELMWTRGAQRSGTPYLARCTEEHSGPHSAWFWDSEAQGGGVLNDLMCHSLEAGRFLLTPPGKSPSEWLRPVSVTATIASLRWSRDRYAQRLEQEYPGVQDYRRTPSEDYANATYTFVNGDGEPVIVEAMTSWGYVGAGMRLSFELLGPEYSMSANSLSGDATVFFSRDLEQAAGEDMLEKQNAEQGLMPVIADEPAAYGYTAENTHISRMFADGGQPLESLDSGVAVTELLMAAYYAAETQTVVQFPIDLGDYVPAVARREWRPRAEKGIQA